MTSWSHGYNVSSGYTFGFYRETAPDWIDFALALRGFEPPRETGKTPFRYLELGCGQGFGLCLLAAANPEGEFLGIDFSPDHIGHAKRLAAKLDLTNVTFVEGDFAELGGSWPMEYGRFDYAVLHGIYSWVPSSIRCALVSCLYGSVAPGGAVYVSYNSMPGWISTLPFQHILRLIEESGGAKGMAAIEKGRALFRQLEGASSVMTKALPALKSRIDTTEKQPAAYLVQEYLHENWHPLWCSQVMTELAEAKLTLSASASLAENLLPGILPRAHQTILQDQPDARMREVITDCLINQTFRRDIFVRGARRRYAGQGEWRGQYRFWRTNAARVPTDISVTTAFGSVKLDAKQFAPIFGSVGEASKSLEELCRLPTSRNDARSLHQTVMLLVHAGWLGCGRREEKNNEIAARVNSSLISLVGAGAPYRYLVAPPLGSAIPASDSDMLMLACHIGNPRAFESEPHVCLKQRLDHLGRRLEKRGQTLSDAEQEASLQEAAEIFRLQTLPLWIQLGVV